VAIDLAGKGNVGTATAVAAVGSPVLDLGLKLSYSAMVSGYSRDLEWEADEEGMRRMAAAGYQPREIGSFFRTMLAETGDHGRHRNVLLRQPSPHERTHRDG
jgi:predicted Zn-dependent protease